MYPYAGEFFVSATACLSISVSFTHFYFSQDSGVEIAAMDATAHTPPGMYKVQVSGETIIEEMIIDNNGTYSRCY